MMLMAIMAASKAGASVIRRVKEANLSMLARPLRFCDAFDGTTMGEVGCGVGRLRSS